MHPSVYTRLSRAKYIQQMCLCSVDIENCFDKLFHDQIVEQYPFPKDYSFLLLRWLRASIVDKNRDFEIVGTINRGVVRGSILGSSIVNLLLSNAFPENLLKESRKDSRHAWAYFFSYADDILLIANNPATFNCRLIELRKNLKRIGLSLNDKKTKSFACIKSKIKFQFLGFAFLIMPRAQLQGSNLLSNMKNLHSLKKGTPGFGIILRPSLERFRHIKKLLKVITKSILHQPRNLIYQSFERINSALLGWGSYYYFDQGCIYGNRVDDYVFRYLRKILIKKFRYNGLLRPRWVAYNFLGLNKRNPNGKKWQPHVFRYPDFSFKGPWPVYIWFCQDIFRKLSITSFLLDSKLREHNYYVFQDCFNKSINLLTTKRLTFALKAKLHNQQNGQCFICDEPMNAKLLLFRGSALQIAQEPDKKKKVLVHERCYAKFGVSNVS